MIYLHSTNGIGYNVILITHENVRDYIKDIPTYFYNLCPAHQADYVRVNVICDYGGIWLDSDTLVMDSLDSLFNILDKQDGFLIKENNDILCNGIFGSKKSTNLMIKWKQNLKQRLDSKNGKISWTEIGNTMLQGLFKTEKSLFTNFEILNGLNNLYPVNWDRCVDEFINKPYNNYISIVRDFQPLIALVNSVYRKLENKSIDEISNGNMPINFFINKSIENHKTKKFKSPIVSQIMNNLMKIRETIKKISEIK